MKRVEIELPEELPIQTEIGVRITDLNYGNHLGNDALLGLLHEARMRWLRPYGYTELEIEDSGLIMVDMAVQFKAEAHDGDRLRIAMGVDDVSNVGFALYYQVLHADTGAEVALARSNMVFFDYKKRKLHRMPEAFRRCLAQG